MSASKSAIHNMGKEIRVALYVVGVLAMLFCGLVYARIYGRGLSLPEASINIDARRIQWSAPANRTVRRQPTIVRSTHWEDLRQPAGVLQAQSSMAPSTADAAPRVRPATEPRMIDPSSIDSGTLVNPRQSDSQLSAYPQP